TSSDRYASAGELGRAAVAAALAPGREGEALADDMTGAAPRPSQRAAAPSERAAPPPGGKPISGRKGPGRLWAANRLLVVGLVGLLVLAVAAAAVVLTNGSDKSAKRATLAPSPPLRAVSSWRPLPPMPTARQNMGGTVLDGTAWVVGGLESATRGSRRVEGYDPVINGWKSGPDLPVRLHHEMVVNYKDDL